MLVMLNPQLPGVALEDFSVIVALSYFPGDQLLAAKLSSWIAELGENNGHTALLARDVRCHPNIDSEILANFKKVFDSVEVITIVERIDGWPQGANVAFGRVAKHIQYTNPQPWLWIESDCVPLKEGWAQALATEYDQEPKKPFLGDYVQVENVVPHMSGVAVYPPKITEYAGMAALATEYAWDVFASDQIVPRMKQTQKIQHKWKHPPFNNQGEVDNLLGQLKDTCVLFHADKSGTLIDFLRERRNLGRQGYSQAERVTAVNPPNDTRASVEILPPTQIICDIFIKTYPKDYEWLGWCARSVMKFCREFRGTVVISEDDKWIKKVPGNFPVRHDLVLKEYGDDHYLSQQVFKMYADTFTDSDYILHIDSDTIFTRPVTPETYFRDGKPIIMITPIEQAHPDEQHAWRQVMHKFMGKPSQYEYMRRHPLVYPRWAYGALREFCLKQHGMTLDKYIMAQPYHQFSEFNVMGFFLWTYYYDKFTWVDTSSMPESEWPVLTVEQEWSHNPIPVEKWEKILADGHGEREEHTVTFCETPVSSPPKPVSQLTLKEKRQAQCAKMRAAKAAKKTSLLRVTSPEVADMLKKEVIGLGSVTPWENKWESLGEINSLCQRLWKYCDAPRHTARVREELRKVGVIR